MSENHVIPATGLLEKYTFDQENQCVIGELTANLDYSRLGPLKKWLGDEFDAGNIRIILDMKQVKMLYSAHMGVMVAMVKKANSLDGNIHFCNLAPAVSNVFKSLDLGGFVKIFDTKDAALQAFNT